MNAYLRVMENGECIYAQQGESIVPELTLVHEASRFEEYKETYFDKFVKTVGEIIDYVDLVLEINIDEKSKTSRMMLCLTEDELPKAEEVEKKLLEDFPEEIWDIYTDRENRQMLFTDHLFYFEFS